MKNIRKLFTIALCLALAAATGLTAFGQTEWSPATVSTSLVVVDGKSVAFGAYNIAGYNYFKLRDLAYAVNGSSKQFSVDWDGANNAIALTSGAPYTPEGSELQPLEGGGRTAWPTTSRITLDGTLVTFEAYNIDGYNYFKLRDVAKAFNIGVGWDGGRNLITISTDEDYVDDSGAAPPPSDTAPSTPPSQGALPTPQDPVTVTLVNHEPQFGTMKAYTPEGRIEIPNGAAIERGNGYLIEITGLTPGKRVASVVVAHPDDPDVRDVEWVQYNAIPNNEGFKLEEGTRFTSFDNTIVTVIFEDIR